ncbi:hypothetical protein [Antrihabitans stalactiti]|uniref:hypothetical protein n=1 Tax=Antrihabitans stalactiti TaxID=2584121 RepID=UPI00146D607C|nr:hypothetical protein [Antrihabitans stalactiti]
MLRNLYEADHDVFRNSVVKFIEQDITPHRERWDESGLIDSDRRHDRRDGR